jgi:membrane-bound ClpP family serine protease
MSFAQRSLIAVGLMSVGLVLLIVDGVDAGWTTLGAVGVAALALAIAAQLVALRQHQAS